MIDLDAIRQRQIDLSVCDLQHYGDSCALLAYVDALREAAGKLTCHTCIGTGLSVLRHDDGTRDMMPCPDCAALRALLNTDALERKP